MNKDESKRIKISEQILKYMKRYEVTKQEAIDMVMEKFPELKRETIERYSRQIPNGAAIKKEITLERQKKVEEHHKKKYLELLRQTTNQQTLVDLITSEITPIQYKKFDIRPEFSNSKRELISDLMCSDAHFGRQVNVFEIEFMNTYNFDIGCSRLYKVGLDLIEYINFYRSKYYINKLYLDLLGDFINDEYRDENKQTNQWPNSITVVNSAKVMSQFVIMLLQNIESIEINGVIGNESRIKEKMPGKVQYHNYDFLLYNMMRSYLAEYIYNGRLVFNIPLSPEIVVEKAGKKALLTHGHNIGAGSYGGIPAYQIMRMIKEQQEMRKSSGGVDMIQLGHYHCHYELDDEMVLVNGSLCGADEWSKNFLRKKGKPSQTAFLMSNEYGIESKRIIKGLETCTEIEHQFDYDYKF